jgi:hypothetical protein
MLLYRSLSQTVDLENMWEKELEGDLSMIGGSSKSSFMGEILVPIVVERSEQLQCLLLCLAALCDSSL